MVVVMNLARRKALYQLVGEIITYMRSQIELPKEEGDRVAEEDATPDHEPQPLATEDAVGDPLTISPVPAEAKAEAEISQRHTRPSAELTALRKEALAHFDQWKNDFLTKLKEVLSVKEDTKILEERKKRQAKIIQLKADVPDEGEDLINFGEQQTTNSTVKDRSKEVEALQAIYHPISTRLSTLPTEDRKEVLSAVLLLLLSTGNYSSHSRAFITYLTSSFELPLSVLTLEEKEIAKTMIEVSTEAEKAKQDGAMSAEAEAQKRKQQNQTSRYWKVGLASVAGAAIIGVTGGLAAPVVAGAIGGLMGSVGLGGLASFLGIFWMNGALVGAFFGAFGARMTVGPLPPLIQDLLFECF